MVVSLQKNTPPRAPIRDGDHYRRLFGRTRWYVILSGPFVLMSLIAYVFLIMRPENPKLSARTLIGLEKLTDVSGLKVGTTSNLGREDIMMSRTFLKDVAKKLSLQVWTKPYARDAIFDLVKMDSSALCGTYSIHFNPGRKGDYRIRFYDTTAISVPLYGFLPGTRFKNISVGNFESDTITRLPGMVLKFSRSLKEHPKDFKFQVVDIRVAVEDVFRNLTIKRADLEKGINYITVLLESRDYSLAAITANTIAEAFIEKNFNYGQQRERGLVESLDKQLEIAQSNLASANAKIRDFRSQNPQVGLNEQTQQTVSNLARLDNGIQGRTSDNTYAENLRKKYSSADTSQILPLTRVVTEFLATYSIVAGRTLKEELDRLTVQQNKLSEIYGPEHPMVLENKHNLNRVVLAIKNVLDEFIDRGRIEIHQKRKNVQQLSNKLRQLPALEMALGDLQRKQQIFSDIYSAVLGSYNKAKVDDAVITADFYVMDYAVAPFPPPADKSQLFIFLALISILISFGPVLGYDFFDKSVRSQRQLERITGRQVLESVPTFHQIKGKNGVRKSGLRPLIYLPNNPIFTREIFFSLQLKINLNLLKTGSKFIVVSSLEDGAGKSTISSNLAISYALRGHQTLLVDCDLRRGTVGETFGIKDPNGFASLLSKQNPLTDDECGQVIVKTLVPNLFVIPSGAESNNPGALLSSPRMSEFKKFCDRHMDFVVIDTPPLGAVSDAAIIQDNFLNYLFVIRYGKSNVSDLVNRINEFDQLPEKVLGYVLNGASLNSMGSYKRYSSYYMR